MKKILVRILLITCLLFLASCKQECPAEYVPVCGTDGFTYVNACYADGQEVEYIGQCDRDLEAQCAKADGNWVAEHRECEMVSARGCELMAGTFNECESACRHVDDPTLACTQQCVPVCTFG